MTDSAASAINLHHVHLATADVAGFCAFFERHFAASVVFDEEIDGDRNVFLKVGTGRIHLFQTRSPAPRGRNIFHHIGLMVDDLHSLVGRLSDNGVEVSEITTVPGGGFAMANGPDGLLIELFEASSAESRTHFVD